VACGVVCMVCVCGRYVYMVCVCACGMWCGFVCVCVCMVYMCMCCVCVCVVRGVVCVCVCGIYVYVLCVCMYGMWCGVCVVYGVVFVCVWYICVCDVCVFVTCGVCMWCVCVCMACGVVCVCVPGGMWCVCVCAWYICVCAVCVLTLSPSTLREGKGRKQACSSPVTTDHKAQGVNKPALSSLEPGSQGPGVTSPRPSEGSGKLRVPPSGRALARGASVQPRLHPPTALLPAGVAPPHLSFQPALCKDIGPCVGAHPTSA